jgi:hypothetical protein
MLTGQLNWIAPTEAPGRQAPPGNFTEGDDSDAVFALVYSEVLGLSDEGCSAGGAYNNWLDLESEEGSLSIFDSNPSQFEIGNGLGKKSPQSMQGGASEERSPRNGLQTVSPEPGLQQVGNPGQLGGSDCNLSQQRSSGDVVNKSELSNWMDAHALTRSSHHCAMYCRLGMEAAGINTGDRPRSGDAGDYGPFLLRHGAQTVSQDSYSPQVGDVVVFDKTGEHPNGHIEMYDGHHWVSDFMQHSFSPYRNADSTPPYTIYRLA